MTTVSQHGNAVNELIDLKDGAWRRLGSEIWDLRNRAEKITAENAKDADAHLKALKRHLAKIESYIAAHRDYSSQLEKLVG